jgi:hypothetical protein
MQKLKDTCAKFCTSKKENDKVSRPPKKNSNKGLCKRSLKSKALRIRWQDCHTTPSCMEEKMVLMLQRVRSLYDMENSLTLI